MKFGSGKPPNSQGKKLENGFEEIYPRLLENPGEWLEVKGLPNPVCLSLKRSVKLSDIGERTAVSIRRYERDLYTVYLRYLP